MRKVTTIPATVNRYTALPITSKEKRKVAGYARVSTVMEEQLTSYEAQVDYYTNYIKDKDDWDFVNVYTDEGITGTSIKHRAGFNKMVKDAFDGKIDLIITKSVSRFARNTVDSLTTIRELKAHNVECYFEKENIWTFDEKGELLLTIMSSIAQEEARSISENCTWGQRKRFSDGKVAIPYSIFLGYDKGDDGSIVINEEQAKIVRRIYGMYLQGFSTYAIAKRLTDEGIPTPGGKIKWYMSTIKSILTNEKYKGDALLQKKFTVDYLTKKLKRNDGEITQYYIKNNHDAIIDCNTFDNVQKIIQEAPKGKNRKSCVSIFSSKIKCGECDSWYGSKVWHSNDKYRRVVWRCNHKYDNKKPCKTPIVDEETIKQAFVTATNKLIKDKDSIIEDFKTIKGKVIDTAALECKRTKLKRKLCDISELAERCINKNAYIAQNQTGDKERYHSLMEEFNRIESVLKSVNDEITEKHSKRVTIDEFLRTLQKQDGVLDDFSEELWISMIEYAIVKNNGKIKLKFKCDYSI